MAEIAGDIFIEPTIKVMDPETKIERIENGPQINLSKFIRGMNFPQLKKPAKRNTNRRIIMIPKTASKVNLNLTRDISSDESVLAKKEKIKQSLPVVDLRLVQIKDVDTPPARQNSNQRVDTPYYSKIVPKMKNETPVDLEVEAIEERAMLRKALEMSLKESVPSSTIAVPHFQELYSSTMSEDEQIAHALKLSMQENENDYPIPV